MSKKGKTSILTDSDVAIVPREPEFPAETSAAETVSAQTEVNKVTGFTFGEAAVPGKAGRKSQLTYPIDRLEANSNQYFDAVVNTSNGKEVTAKLASIRAYAYRNNYAVTMRQVEGAIRVWRKAEKLTRSRKTSE